MTPSTDCKSSTSAATKVVTNESSGFTDVAKPSNSGDKSTGPNGVTSVSVIVSVGAARVPPTTSEHSLLKPAKLAMSYTDPSPGTTAPGGANSTSSLLSVRRISVFVKPGLVKVLT